jgi:phage shock protein C
VYGNRRRGGMKKLYLSNTDRKIGGVCGGLGEYFDKDSTIFRILFVLVTLLWGAGILLYLIMWLIIPRKPVVTEKKADT